MRKTLEQAVKDGDEYWFKDEQTEKEYMDNMFANLCLILGMYEVKDGKHKDKSSNGK